MSPEAFKSPQRSEGHGRYVSENIALVDLT